MVRHTINIPTDTDQQVKAVLGDRSMDDFTAEALKRHAYREKAVEQLLADVAEADASGTYPGTLDNLASDMGTVIDQVEADNAKR